MMSLTGRCCLQTTAIYALQAERDGTSVKLHLAMFVLHCTVIFAVLKLW